MCGSCLHSASAHVSWLGLHNGPCAQYNKHREELSDWPRPPPVIHTRVFCPTPRTGPVRVTGAYSEERLLSSS